MYIKWLIISILGNSQLFCFFQMFKINMLSVPGPKQCILIQFDNQNTEINIPFFFQLENKELRELLSISSESLQVRKENSMDTASQAIK